MTDSVNRILSALSAVRVPAAPGEYDLHALIAAALDEAGIAYAHEAKLADGARIDFLAGSVGVEVKKSRPERARLLRQVDKYLACAEVDALIVVSQRTLSLPAACRGKPVILFTLNRLWGVSLP